MASPSDPEAHPETQNDISSTHNPEQFPTGSRPASDPTQNGFGEAQNPITSRGQLPITPEPRLDQLAMNINTPSTPGLLPAFDWEDFQSRYEKALSDADEQEHAILQDFEKLTKYFDVWASASAAHDNERAVKRLQTRQRYVTLSEESMAQKQKHYDEVLRAFQSALALLSSK